MLALKGPKDRICGEIQISGSKSISNRLLILQNLPGFNITYSNISDSEDTALLQKAFDQIKVGGKQLIDVHHAGTDMRFLTAYLANTPGDWTITGSERLKERPIEPLVNALKEMGADITYLDKNGFPPLLIKGKQLRGGKVKADASISSQFASALLLIAPALSEDLILELSEKQVSAPYLEMTVSLLQSCGIEINRSVNLIEVKNNNSVNLTRHINIESDWSSASYYYSICAISPGSEITLSHFYKNSLQADAVLPQIYSQLGVSTEYKGSTIILRNQPPATKTFSYDFSSAPDIAQTIAVTCYALGIKAQLTGLVTLKYKESDRIIALKTELEKLGATVEASENSIHVYPILNPSLTKHTIETYADHRMALSFSALALIHQQINFSDHNVVNKSYPAFWRDLVSLGFSVNLQP